MSAAAHLDLLYPAAGSTLAAAGTLLLLWSLFYDRPRGRRRCPRCWYDMHATPGLTCPECGRTAKRERKLFRTRRRWRWVPAAALLALAAPVVAAIPTVRERGWIRAIPTWALVWVAPVDEGAWTWMRGWFPGMPPFASPVNPLLVELLRRTEEDRLRPWEWQVLFDRVYAARPDQRGFLLQARNGWPRDQLVFVEPISTHPIPLNEDFATLRVRIRSSGRGWTEFSLGSRAEATSLGLPPSGAASFDIEGELLGNQQLTGVPGRSCIWCGTLRTVKVVESAQELMRPVPDPEGDANIVRMLEPRLSSRGGKLGLSLKSVGYHLGADAEDWALGLHVEVLKDGVVQGLGDVLYPMVEKGAIADFLVVEPPCYPLIWEHGSPTRDELSRGSWLIRLRGDPRVAIRDFWRTSYWAGTVEVPVTPP